jgi:hypothetical protein
VQHSYNKTLNKGANYIQVPLGLRSEIAIEAQVAGVRLKRRHGRMVPMVRKGLAKRRLEVVEGDVKELLHRRTKDMVDEVAGG